VHTCVFIFGITHNTSSAWYCYVVASIPYLMAWRSKFH